MATFFLAEYVVDVAGPLLSWEFDQPPGRSSRQRQSNNQHTGSLGHLNRYFIAGKSDEWFLTAAYPSQPSTFDWPT